MALVYRQSTTDSRWKGRFGVALTVALHALVIGLVLAAKSQIATEPAPLLVTLFAEAPQQNQPLPVNLSKPNLTKDASSLRVPQPEILLADTSTTNAVVLDAGAPAPRAITPEQPAPSQPRFDVDYLNNPAPRYPALSRRLREEGVVMLRVYVLPNGLPDTVELKRSSGSARLDESALCAVRNWRFVPARSGEMAVAAWVLVPIAFSLAA